MMQARSIRAVARAARRGLASHPISAPAASSTGSVAGSWLVHRGVCSSRSVRDAGLDTSIVDHEPAPIVRGDLTLDGTATSVDLSSVPGASSVDPFALVASDLATVSTNVQGQLAVDHPVLQTVAEYFFTHDGGKKFRPAMVLLVARAVAELPPGEMLFVQAQAAADLLAGSGLTIPGYRTRALTPHRDAAEVAESQMRLAEITEMIHTASLLHDDVIDDADTRRGMPAVNSVFGNKLAILAGDFLLARASISLARLRDVPVIETMSTIIEHLVKGEVLQMRPQTRDDAQMTQFEMEGYLTKNFYKTASLIANSCRSSVMLSGRPDEIADAAYRYGKHIGIAFQLVDDALDFSGTTESLGKPALNDLRQGLATAPVLFAAQTHADVSTMIERKFNVPGDAEAAAEYVQQSGGVDKTMALAVAHSQMAVEALELLPDSKWKDALAALAVKVVSRSS